MAVNSSEIEPKGSTGDAISTQMVGKEPTIQMGLCKMTVVDGAVILVLPKAPAHEALYNAADPFEHFILRRSGYWFPTSPARFATC